MKLCDRIWIMLSKGSKKAFLFTITFLFLSHWIHAQCPTAANIQQNSPTVNTPDSCVVSSDVNQGLWFGTQTLTINSGGILTIDGNMNIYDNVVVNGKLYVTGNFNAIFPAQVTINPGGEVIIGGNVIGIGGDMTIDGSMTVDGDLTNIGGDVGGSGDLDVGGTITGDTGGLPVEWLDIEAIAYEGKIKINWSTAQEIGNDYFTVERSINGFDFEPLDEIQGAGYSIELQNYSFIDTQPYVGLAYYRIRQTDYDGQSDVSSVVAIVFDPFKLEGENQITVYPNPVHDELNIYFNSVQKTENAHILIMDLSGRICLNDYFSVDRYRLIKLDIDRLTIARGFYILKIHSEENIYSSRILIE